MNVKHFKIIFIRPSTYDDEGYVYRYWRGILPSNTVACLKSLTKQGVESGELGKDVDVTIDSYDETVERLPIGRIVRQSKRRHTRVLIAFAGVQTNQFARTTDLALKFRSHGLQVMLGGFHVSGVLAMFDEPSRELQHLLDNGVTLVKGEAEVPGALAGILRDALHDRLQPLYDIKGFPDLLHAPVPEPDTEIMKKFVVKNISTIDTSRGCCFGCTFCTVINVQGRKMRHRSAQCVVDAIETNYENGIKSYFFTDDNFARNPVWEDIFDGLIALREKGIKITFMMQVDTRAHLIPRFVEKAEQAGCYQAFIGMESLNPKNIEVMGKAQNKVSDYSGMVTKWHNANILVHVGYIVGLPFDTRESIRKDVEMLRNNVKVDEASFFMLTPLPGSKDHWDMVQRGTPMDADPNNFDSLHETFRHGKMAPGEWKKAYHDCWQSFYSKENIINILLQTPHKQYWKMYWILLWYRYDTLEGTHPMVSPLIRLKHRKERRSTFPRENVFKYAWRRTKEWSWLIKTYAGLFFEFQEIWFLTRKPDDPKWATLADLRTRWSEAQQRLHDSAICGQWETASQELRALLKATSENLQHLSLASKHQSRSLRRELKRKTRELDNYIRTFDSRLPDWRRLAEAEEYFSKSLLAGYEEGAIRYVAARRHVNEYRRYIIDRFKTGRILTINVSPIPRLLLLELLLTCRFGITFLPKLY